MSAMPSISTLKGINMFAVALNVDGCIIKIDDDLCVIRQWTEITDEEVMCVQCFNTMKEYFEWLNDFQKHSGEETKVLVSNSELLEMLHR